MADEQELEIEPRLRLKYTRRWDEEAKVFVANIPALGIMTQARTEKTLHQAVTSAARTYLQICAERGLLLKMKGGKR